MASTSKVQSDGPPAVQSPQLQQSTDEATDAVVPDAHPGRGETVPVPLNLPDICKPEWQRDGMPDTEFYRKYPPDPWGEEAAPNARVWKLYRDQQDLSHNSMLGGWNKTLDVLLIFAGLFSAVLTAFLIESYKALQPDYAQYVAAFLYAAAVSHNSTGGIFPSLDTIMAPDRFIQTSIAQRWTNGLWFSSLVISLAVALLCILIKQWLDSYDSQVSAASPSPMHWARRHTLYNRGLRNWGVPELISLLPLLLHVSFFLFFVGLILFLRPLDGAISYSLLVMVSCIGAFYILSLFLPVWRVECPSYTPLSAQALRVVSWATALLAYIVTGLSGLGLCAPGRLRDAIGAMSFDAVQWLESFQLRTRARDAHETQTMNRYIQELDGYVLSALIRLPTDSKRDIVNAACAALPAVGWSRRVIDVIFREVPSQVLSDKLIDCDRDIPWTATAFAIASHEQLLRAHEAVRLPDFHSYWYFTRTSRSLSRRGRDSLLPQALGLEEAAGNQPNIDLLIRHLQALASLKDSSPGLPRRSSCMIYLQFYTICPDLHPLGLSCFLLLFCAGRFASADTKDLVRGLQSVHLVLQRNHSIEISADYAGERDYILSVANGLWLMLAESPLYSIDTRTAQIVATQTFAVFIRFFNHRAMWAQISGLSAFVRSPNFIHCVGTEDSLGTRLSLARYMEPIVNSQILDRTRVRLEDYWECIATLSKYSWDRTVSPPDDAVFFSIARELFPVEPNHWNYVDRLSNGGPYQTQDEWYEPALSAFLVGSNAIATWGLTTASPSADEDKRTITLAELAHRISIVLCRGERLGRDNGAFVSAFFSGPFVLARFQDRVSRQRPISQHGFPERWTKFSYEEAVDDLAKHCLKLSMERFTKICADLEETGDAGSEVRSRAVALAQRFRNDSTPGGPLSPECDASCACMLPAARAPTPTRWDALAARFRRGGTEPTTSSNV